MKTIKVYNKLTIEERETIYVYDGVNKTWNMTSMVPKHFRKALKQGWEPIAQYVHEDNTVCGMEFVAPERALTIRSTAKKQMSEKQMKNLLSDNDE